MGERAEHHVPAHGMAHQNQRPAGSLMRAREDGREIRLHLIEQPLVGNRAARRQALVAPVDRGHTETGGEQTMIGFGMPFDEIALAAREQHMPARLVPCRPPDRTQPVRTFRSVPWR